jgi:hypothetical protein
MRRAEEGRGIRHDRAQVRNCRALQGADPDRAVEQLDHGDRNPEHEIQSRKAQSSRARRLERPRAGSRRDRNAFRRARQQSEAGKTCRIEFITSAETAFSHR